MAKLSAVQEALFQSQLRESSLAATLSHKSNQLDGLLGHLTVIAPGLPPAAAGAVGAAGIPVRPMSHLGGAVRSVSTAQLARELVRANGLLHEAQVRG